MCCRSMQTMYDSAERYKFDNLKLQVRPILLSISFVQTSEQEQLRAKEIELEAAKKCLMGFSTTTDPSR